MQDVVVAVHTLFELSRKDVWVVIASSIKDRASNIEYRLSNIEHELLVQLVE